MARDNPLSLLSISTPTSASGGRGKTEARRLIVSLPDERLGCDAADAQGKLHLLLEGVCGNDELVCWNDGLGVNRARAQTLGSMEDNF
mmetsp:Transcript_133166/g.230471  ORF Transcript_133166/g.230471 Transcript_133166/m.230471 type:complete len:88 (+) Transcript_133166:382-645(+)